MARVLIIDDDEHVTRLLETHLTEEGHHVTVTHDGQQGLVEADRMSPDLIMLDVFLPDVTGYQMCNSLRKNETTRTTPIIMMTGAARFPNQQTYGRERGANEYIFKPFDIVEVGDLVHKYIQPQAAAPAFAPPPEPEISVSLPVIERFTQIQQPEPPQMPKLPQLPKSDSTMDALTSFVKQVMLKDDLAEGEETHTHENGNGSFSIHIPEPLEPLVPIAMPPKPVMPAVEKKPTPVPVIEISSLASRLSWLMMAHKINLLDASSKADLEKTCQSLITLLADFVKTEKKQPLH